ncbi:MAG TPA: sigma-54 dependent transcriptional regulator [Thermoanaerobaculia bacterium]|nr:sigma-54 dependent transcriptional regulator [Thermoanaerobaculia bacterium]
MPKVLIVEDHAAVAKALRLLLETNDIDCVTTSDPDRAIALVERGEVDLVLQDMNFTAGSTSGAEGMSLFRRLRAIDDGMPVMLLTAWTSLESAVQLIKEGASDYLAKPWDDEKLLTTVRTLLDRQPHRRPAGIIYESDAMDRVISLALKVARSDVPVLITGPNGAGKEKIAEIIQTNSLRRDQPFVRVNAGALPEQLIESELFGAEPGAYTGSQRLRIGRFETAHRGTLFLDEIANLPLAGQAKLLRVLQSGQFERLGSSETRRVDVRVLCATNADLREAIARGTFREDLFFRLNVIEIAVPALKRRREDILPLAEAFAKGKTLSGDAREALVNYDWPGNVRELQNRITRATVISSGDTMTATDLGFTAEAGERDTPLERKEIEFALRNADGSVSRAAATLGVSRQALYRKMEKLGIVIERRPRGSE